MKLLSDMEMIFGIIFSLAVLIFAVYISTALLKAMNQSIFEKYKPDTSDMKSRPTPEQFGWYNQNGFDDEISGWKVEGGEEAYYEALEKWKSSQKPWKR